MTNPTPDVDSQKLNDALMQYTAYALRRAEKNTRAVCYSLSPEMGHALRAASALVDAVCHVAGVVYPCMHDARANLGRCRAEASVARNAVAGLSSPCRGNAALVRFLRHAENASCALSGLPSVAASAATNAALHAAASLAGMQGAPKSVFKVEKRALAAVMAACCEGPRRVHPATPSVCFAPIVQPV